MSGATRAANVADVEPGGTLVQTFASGRSDRSPARPTRIPGSFDCSSTQIAEPVQSHLVA